MIFLVLSSMVMRPWLELWRSELKAIWKGGEVAMPALSVYLGQKAMFSLPDPFPFLALLARLKSHSYF